MVCGSAKTITRVATIKNRTTTVHLNMVETSLTRTVRMFMWPLFIYSIVILVTPTKKKSESLSFMNRRPIPTVPVVQLSNILLRCRLLRCLPPNVWTMCMFMTPLCSIMPTWLTKSRRCTKTGVVPVIATIVVINMTVMIMFSSAFTVGLTN